MFLLFYFIFFFLLIRRQVFVFDGATGVTVPPEVISHNLTRNFTMSVWLKHDHHAGQDKHVKEHILCNADDHRKIISLPSISCYVYAIHWFLFIFIFFPCFYWTEMNRHHFSLFIRNCRLILLLRREFGDGDLKSFRPAEFRWKLPQVTFDFWIEQGREREREGRNLISYICTHLSLSLFYCLLYVSVVAF